MRSLLAGRTAWAQRTLSVLVRSGAASTTSGTAATVDLYAASRAPTNEGYGRRGDNTDDAASLRRDQQPRA